MESIIVQLAKLELEAGDMLAVMVPQHLHCEQRARMAETLKTVLPTGVKFAVFDGGVSLAKISAAEVAS